MKSEKWNARNESWQMECGKCTVKNEMWQLNVTIILYRMQSDRIKSIKNPLLKIWKSIGLLEREV